MSHVITELQCTAIPIPHGHGPHNQQLQDKSKNKCRTIKSQHSYEVVIIQSSNKKSIHTRFKRETNTKKLNCSSYKEFKKYARHSKPTPKDSVLIRTQLVKEATRLNSSTATINSKTVLVLSVADFLSLTTFTSNIFSMYRIFTTVPNETFSTAVSTERYRRSNTVISKSA